MFLLCTFLFRRLNLTKMLANPLAMPIKDQVNSKRGTYLYYHSLLFLGLGCWIAAALEREIRKFTLYDKYKREVSYYVRWKMEEEIKKSLWWWYAYWLNSFSYFIKNVKGSQNKCFVGLYYLTVHHHFVQYIMGLLYVVHDIQLANILKVFVHCFHQVVNEL